MNVGNEWKINVGVKDKKELEYLAQLGVLPNLDTKMPPEYYIDMFFKRLDIELPEETPLRYTKMMRELTEYQNLSNEDIANELNKLFPVQENTKQKNIVVVKDINVFSLCEHHIALMYDMNISVGYIPNKEVLGLSKIARACNCVCKRLQLQEKIGADIIDVMKMITNSKDIAVKISAKHSCITARGIKSANAITTSTHFSGKFYDDYQMQLAFFDMCK